jgi:5-methylcytosine-specific restriction endonuclease McrA
MKQLLELFKYIVNHPDEYLQDVLNRPEFKGVYWYFSEYRGKKMGFCPTCPLERQGEHRLLTKHHIRPKKNGGKGLKDNFFYICRECHDEVHYMESKIKKIAKYLKENPNATLQELMRKFNTTQETVIKVLYPKYSLKITIKYQMRIMRRIKDAFEMMENQEKIYKHEKK